MSEAMRLHACDTRGLAKARRSTRQLSQGRQVLLSAVSKEVERGTRSPGQVVERVGRQVRRLPLDGSAPELSEEGTEESKRDWIATSKDAVKGFALPRGWPGSVTPDYLSYQLWAVPSHITGWISVSLATSSLLKALGASPGPTGTAGAAAAIKWITKDGIGAAGRLLVGGRLGGVFDEDPRRWRMVAEAFATLGLALEIATAFNPQWFVALAGAGNFSKAIGKGLGKPCFRIIQTHFAQQNNVGDISAKEEVWEVAAQLTGLAASVLILRGIETSHTPSLVLPAWAAAQSAHVLLRLRSLRTLQFSFLNQKRACAAVTAYVRGQQVPSVQEANGQEPILQAPPWVRPQVTLGCTLKEALAHLSPSLQQGHTGQHGSEASSAPHSHSGQEAAASSLQQPGSAVSELKEGTLEALRALTQVYQQKDYMLVWSGGAAKVLLRDGISGSDTIRPLLQAAWLEMQRVQDATLRDLQDSQAQAEALFPGFLSALEQQGWDLAATTIRTGPARLSW